MAIETSEQILANNQERINNVMSEAEQIHYFGLCKPDHSDCPFLFCAIRQGELSFVNVVEVFNSGEPEKIQAMFQRLERTAKLD